MTATTPNPIAVCEEQLAASRKARAAEWLTPEVLAAGPIPHDGYTMDPRPPIPNPNRYARNAVDHILAALTQEAPDAGV